MVNGLVDPLQSGVYARSIASIAVQIGLPAWLVEMRHAATHEDLPSLELLREGAREVGPSRIGAVYRLNVSAGYDVAFTQLFLADSIPTTRPRTSRFFAQAVGIPFVRV